MKVREINPRQRSAVQAFVQFPLDLYRDCEHWFPPLASAVRLTLNRRQHPFYQHSAAAFFLAEEAGRTVGRLAVLENRRYNDYHQQKVAFFYYFDALDNPDVARELFAAAGRWAQARGLTTLLGPKGFVRSDAPGLLVEGFEYRAALSMPYNFAYYPALMEAAGFSKEVDYLSGYLANDYEFPERFARIVERVKERRGYWVKSFQNKAELRAWIPRIQRINNEAFTDVWGYYPIDDAEAEMVGRQLLSVADPRMIKVLLQGDEVIGFCFIFPDISAALKTTEGRLWPFGWIRILREFKRTRRLSANGVGLLPAHQGLGGSALLYTEFAKLLINSGAEHCDVAQALESNLKSLGDMNALGVNWYKRHRVYRRDLTIHPG